MPNETNTQTQPDFREAQRLLIGDRRIELKDAINEELILMSLYNSPSALKALLLCKRSEIVTLVDAAMKEARKEVSKAYAELKSVREKLSAVANMRDRLTESLSNCFALYGCDSIAELRLEVLQEAKAQKAKEAQV